MELPRWLATPWTTHGPVHPLVAFRQTRTSDHAHAPHLPQKRSARPRRSPALLGQAVHHQSAQKPSLLPKSSRDGGAPRKQAAWCARRCAPSRRKLVDIAGDTADASRVVLPSEQPGRAGRSAHLHTHTHRRPKGWTRLQASGLAPAVPLAIELPRQPPTMTSLHTAPAGSGDEQHGQA